MKVVLVLFIFVIYRQVESQTAQKYCGQRFSRVIASLCYPSTQLVKRYGGWWMAKERARVLGTIRGKRGPAEECCDKPCTVEELRTYCEWV